MPYDSYGFYYASDKPKPTRYTYAIHAVANGRYIGSETAETPQKAINQSTAKSPLSYSNGRYSVAAPAQDQYGIFEVTVEKTEGGLSFHKVTQGIKAPPTSAKRVFNIHSYEDGNYLITQDAVTPDEAIEKASVGEFMGPYFKAGKRYIVSAQGQRCVGVFEAVSKPAKTTVTATRVYA